MSKTYTEKKKKTQMALILGIIGLIAYIFVLLFIIHYKIVELNYPRLKNIDILTKALDSLLNAPFAIMPLPEGILGTAALLTFMIAIVGILMYVSSGWKKHYNPDTVNGDAKWLSELEEYDKRFTEPLGKKGHDGYYNMILSQDLFLSMNGNSSKVRRNLNVFAIGGSGAGKSYNLVGPNLMQANCSYVITDPSGGLFKEYGHFLEYMGYRVKCFNLDHMDRGNHYNPFNYIHSDKDIEVLVTTLISNTTPPDSKSNDPFWENSEKAFFTAIIAYLYHYCKKEEQTFENVMRLLRSATLDEASQCSKSQLDIMFDEIKKKDPHGLAIKQYQTFKLASPKTASSILISAAVRLNAFDLDDVIRLTNTDDIDLDSIGDEKTALFIIIPTGEKTFNFLASMMYSQLFQRMYSYAENTAEFGQLVVDSKGDVLKTFRAEDINEKDIAYKAAEAFIQKAKTAKIVKNEKYSLNIEEKEEKKKKKTVKRTYGWYEIRAKDGELLAHRGSKEEAKKALHELIYAKIVPMSSLTNHGQRLPIHVRFMMDEFANTGKIPEFSEKVATIRKYEISVTIILQSLTQIQKLFKDDWSSITGNCDNTIYLGGGADTDTTEWISKLFGNETRIVMNTSYGAGGKDGSTSYNRQGVELYSAAQLRTMPEDECIVIGKSLDAFKGKKYKSDLHPMRELVLSFPSYVYNPGKQEYMQAAYHPVIDKHEIEKKISEEREKMVKPESPEETKKREEKNKIIKEQAQLAENNETIAHKPLIEEPSLKVEEISKNLGLHENMTEEEIEKSVDDIYIENDENELDEMIFSSF